MRLPTTVTRTRRPPSRLSPGGTSAPPPGAPSAHAAPGRVRGTPRSRTRPAGPAWQQAAAERTLRSGRRGPLAADQRGNRGRAGRPGGKSEPRRPKPITAPFSPGGSEGIGNPVRAKVSQASQVEQFHAPLRPRGRHLTSSSPGLGGPSRLPATGRLAGRKRPAPRIVALRLLGATTDRSGIVL